MTNTASSMVTARHHRRATPADPEAAAALRCDPETVRRMVHAGRLPHMRLGASGAGNIRIPVEALRHWISQQLEVHTPNHNPNPHEAAAHSRFGRELVSEGEGFRN